MNTRTIKKNISKGFGYIIDLFKIDEVELNSIKHYESDLILEFDDDDSNSIFNKLAFYPTSKYIQDNVISSIDIKILNYFSTKPSYSKDGIIPVRRSYKRPFYIILSYIKIVKNNVLIEDIKKYELDYNGLKLNLTKREFDFDDYIKHFFFSKKYTTEKMSIRKIDLAFCLDSIIIENDLDYLNFLTKQWKSHMENNVDSIIQNLERIDKRKEKYEDQKIQKQ